LWFSAEFDKFVLLPHQNSKGAYMKIRFGGATFELKGNGRIVRVFTPKELKQLAPSKKLVEHAKRANK